MGLLASILGLSFLVGKAGKRLHWSPKRCYRAGILVAGAWALACQRMFPIIIAGPEPDITPSQWRAFVRWERVWHWSWLAAWAVATAAIAFTGCLARKIAFPLMPFWSGIDEPVFLDCDIETEGATVRAFFRSVYRARYCESAEIRARHWKLVGALAERKTFEERYVEEIPDSPEGAVGVAKLLAERGAPARCYVISMDRQIDTKQMQLSDALGAVYATGKGTLISCIPGTLAYYEGKYRDEHCILDRRLRRAAAMPSFG